MQWEMRAIGRAAELTSAIATISDKITQLLGLDFAGVDLYHKGDHFAILEANSSPGLKFEQVCKVNLAGQIADFVVKRIRATITDDPTQRSNPLG